MAGRIAYYGNIVKDGLVLDLDAAKKDSYPGSGTVWRDISGNGFNATLINDPTFTTGNGGGITFDGSNDYAQGNNSLASVINNNQITFIIWARIGDINTRMPLFAKYQPSTPFGYVLDVGSIGGGFLDRSMRFYAQGSNSFYSSDYRGTTILSSNTTYMFTVVFAPSLSIMRMYYNNIEMPATQINVNWTLTTGWAGGSNSYFLGAYQPSIGVYGNSTIYNTMVYNRALSASEVLQNYNALKGRYGL